MNLSHFIKK